MTPARQSDRLYAWRCPVHKTLGPDPGVGWRDGEVKCWRRSPGNPNIYCGAVCERFELVPADARLRVEWPTPAER